MNALMPTPSYGDIPFFTLQPYSEAIVRHILLDVLRSLVSVSSWMFASAAGSDIHAVLPVWCLEALPPS
jgi:hypothetical protein